MGSVVYSSFGVCGIQQLWGQWYRAVMGVSGIYLKIQTHYISHTTPKKASQNTHYRNRLMLQTVPTVGTEPAVYAVT
jgi:hypothetical protein